jgi:hypothetical protein
MRLDNDLVLGDYSLVLTHRRPAKFSCYSPLLGVAFFIHSSTQNKSLDLRFPASVS